MSNLNRLKMKNLIMFLLVSLFTTTLLATETLKSTKIENSIVTKISLKDKPIIFENLTHQTLNEHQKVFNYLDINLISNLKFEIKKPKSPSGFNYKKHHRKTKYTKTLNKVFDRNHCNNYRQGQS